MQSTLPLMFGPALNNEPVPLVVAEAPTTPLETWCLSLVRALRSSQNDTSRAKEALHKIREKYAKKGHKIVDLEDQLAALRVELNAAREDRDDWRAKSGRTSMDLTEALRLMDELQQGLCTDAPPHYASVNHKDGSALVPDTQILGCVLLQQYMGTIAMAKLDQKTFIRESFRILSNKYRQLSGMVHLQPMQIVNVMMFLLNYTINLELWSGEGDWNKNCLKVQQYWCVLDDSLTVALRHSLEDLDAVARFPTGSCERANCRSCRQGTEWLSLQLRISTLRIYAEQVESARQLVQNQIPDTIAYRFLHASSSWLEDKLRSELPNLLDASPGDCLIAWKTHALDFTHQTETFVSNDEYEGVWGLLYTWWKSVCTMLRSTHE